jgi:hypothetical protein
MDVPLWAAIVIGFGSGLFATGMRISYERTAELRSRMIQAADEFATAAFRTIAGLRDAPKKVQDADYVADPEVLGETAEECGVLTWEQRSFGEQAVLQRVVANGPLPFSV